jgi:hypothetical protein
MHIGVKGTRGSRASAFFALAKGSGRSGNRQTVFIAGGGAWEEGRSSSPYEAEVASAWGAGPGAMAKGADLVEDRERDGGRVSRGFGTAPRGDRKRRHAIPGRATLSEGRCRPWVNGSSEGGTERAAVTGRWKHVRAGGGRAAGRHASAIGQSQKWSILECHRKRSPHCLSRRPRVPRQVGGWGGSIEAGDGRPPLAGRSAFRRGPPPAPWPAPRHSEPALQTMVSPALGTKLPRPAVGTQRSWP